MNINFNIKFQEMKNKQKQPIKYFSVGKQASPKINNPSHNPAHKPNNSGTNRINLDKSDQDLKWLQKLITGFEWYKMKKDCLFEHDTEQDTVATKKVSAKFWDSTFKHKVGLSKAISHRNELQKSKTNIMKQNKKKQKFLNQKKFPNTPSSKKINSSRLDKVQAKVQSFRNKDPNQKINTYSFKKPNSNTQSKKRVNEASRALKTVQVIENNRQDIDEIDCSQIQQSRQFPSSFRLPEQKNSQNRRQLCQESGINIGRIVKNSKSVQQSKFRNNSAPKPSQIILPSKKAVSKQQKFIYIQGLKTEQPENICEKKQSEQHKEYRNKRIQSLKKQLKFNNYEYYIESNQNASMKNQLQQKKKQRKLNCSVGAKRDVQSQKQKIKKQIVKLNNNQIRDKSNRKIIENGIKPKEEIRLHQKQGHLNILESLPLSKLKYVVSTKNSEVVTEQNSYVLQRISEEIEGQPMQLPDKLNLDDQDSKQDQWNIIEIFKKLDQKKLGKLNANNCSIELLSRELRYIFGGVLERILYADVELDLQEFLERSEEVLNKINCVSLNKHPYLQIKQLAAKTARNSQKFTKDVQNRNLPSSIEWEGFQKQQVKPIFKFCNKQQQNIRLATFQNQDDEQFSQIKANTDLKDDEEASFILQKKIVHMDEVNTVTSLLDQIKFKTQNCAEQSTQIQKLDLLNRRLQKYLDEQSISKLKRAGKFRY